MITAGSSIRTITCLKAQITPFSSSRARLPSSSLLSLIRPSFAFRVSTESVSCCSGHSYTIALENDDLLMKLQRATSRAFLPATGKRVKAQTELKNTIIQSSSMHSKAKQLDFDSYVQKYMPSQQSYREEVLEVSPGLTSRDIDDLYLQHSRSSYNDYLRSFRTSNDPGRLL